MAEYIVLTLDPNDDRKRRTYLYCSNDEAAVRIAKDLARGRDIEILHGSRQVTVINRSA